MPRRGRSSYRLRMTRLLVRLFMLGLRANAALTRSRFSWLETELLTPSFVKLTFLARGRRQVAGDARSLGREWERLLGATGAAHVVAHDAETAYGEIRVRCPLRGSRDVAACHRLMAYDRGLLHALGGQLIVLESQAEAGRTHCRVAIRRAAADSSDLVPAHRRRLPLAPS